MLPVPGNEILKASYKQLVTGETLAVTPVAR